MNDDSVESQRRQADRRNRPTSPLDAFRPSGRRVWPRRSEERLGAFFTDRFDAVTLAMVVTLLILTIADGVLTLELLDFNSEEVNPFMKHLLKRGPHAFLLGKYVLTAMGLPFIVVYKNYPMFGTRFRVGYLLLVFISLYLALLLHQWMLFRAGPVHSPIVWPEAALPADSRSGVPLIEVQGTPQRRFMP
jgi:Domain of unknown function (DUF5658)